MLSAYLQIRYPEVVCGACWLTIPSGLFESMPDDMRGAARGCVDPVFPMRKCIYGHPISGMLYVQSAISVITQGGYAPSPFVPAVFVHTGGDALCSLYVDGNSVSGSTEALDEFGNLLGGAFPIGFVGDHVRILVVNPVLFQRGDFDVLKIGMGGCSKSIAERCEESCAGAKPATVPGGIDVRGRQEVGCLKKKAPDYVFSIVAMVLWLARVGRGDILVACIALTPRSTCWGGQCDIAFACLVGYIAATAAESLHMHVSHRDRGVQSFTVELRTDSNLAQPRSVSGFFAAIKGTHWSLIHITWSARGQVLSVGSSAMAGVTACVHGVKEALAALTFIGEFILRQEGALPVDVDNVALIRVAKRGGSRKLSVPTKAIGLRRALLQGITQLGLIGIRYVATRMDRSNIFTKLLTMYDCGRGRRMIGVCNSDEFSRAAVTDVERASLHDDWDCIGKCLIRLRRSPRQKLLKPGPSLFADGKMPAITMCRTTVICRLDREGQRGVRAGDWSDQAHSESRATFQWVGMAIFLRVGDTCGQVLN